MGPRYTAPPMKHLVLATLVAFSLLFSTAAASDAPLAGAPVVKLIDAGKGAKRQLRLTPKKGGTRTMVMTMKMAMKIAIGANSMPQQTLPTMKLTMNTKITDVSASGDIKYTFVVKQPDVIADKDASGMADQLKDKLKGIAGMSGYAVVTNRGFTKEADFNIPADADPQMKQIMDSFKQSLYQIAAPLPEEAVGVGAKWDTIMQMTYNGMTLDQTASTELVELTGDIGKLKLSITQSAKPQKITANGMQVDVLSLASTGNSETTIDLKQVTPSQAAITSHSDAKMDAGGTKVAMQIDLTIGVTSK